MLSLPSSFSGGLMSRNPFLVSKHFPHQISAGYGYAPACTTGYALGTTHGLRFAGLSTKLLSLWGAASELNSGYENMRGSGPRMSLSCFRV